MREVLRRRFKDCPVHVPRSEVEALGAEVGLEATEATRLFDRLKGVSWRGYNVRTDDGRDAAWAGGLSRSRKRVSARGMLPSPPGITRLGALQLAGLASVPSPCGRAAPRRGS